LRNPQFSGSKPQLQPWRTKPHPISQHLERTAFKTTLWLLFRTAVNITSCSPEICNTTQTLYEPVCCSCTLWTSGIPGTLQVFWSYTRAGLLKGSG
jgi:hypothetical protein